MLVRRIGRLSAEVQVGDLRVIALSDGQTLMPATHLHGPDGAPLAAADLASADIIDGKLVLPVTAFAVCGPDGVVLIDAGAGDAWHPVLGGLPAAMAEAGIDPDHVQCIALTHTHVDHIGGLVRPDGKPAFANARIFVPEAECALFRAEARMAPLLAQMVAMQPGEGIMDGVMAIAAPGHEVGHTAFLVGGSLLIWGDLIHHAAVQFAQPHITWAFDTDPDMARVTRASLIARAASEGWPVAGAHLPFPAIGRISHAGQGYHFAPITMPATNTV